MANRSADIPLLPSAGVIRRGVQAFIVFSCLGTLLGIWWKRPSGMGELLSQLQWPFIGLLLPLIALDFWLGGLRYRLFFDGKTMPFVSIWDCMRSNWANMFMGAATPFQTGGAPAQIYVLWRCGVPVADSLLISTVNLVATLTFFLLSSLLALFWLPADLFGENFAPIFRVGFSVVTAIVSILLLFLSFPTVAHKALSALFRVLPGKSQSSRDKRTRILDRVHSELLRVRQGFRSILRHNKTGIFLTIIVTHVLFFNKYLMGYVVARAMGQEVPFEIFIGLQVIQLLLIYFAPTPGASGIAELSSVWLMGKLMPESTLLIYALLWRLTSTILGAIFGSVVLLYEFRDQSKDK
ncbi:MAG: flippase-like domain-containing protein [Saprospiraceae bacterium]|nr:flippase-like domain-containing protein [Saprospiraceae bacterium]